MINNNSKYDYKLIAISVFVIALIYGMFFSYLDNTKKIIRIILEAKTTYFLLWTITIYIFVLHYIRHKSKDIKSDTIITKKFGVFFDNAFGGVAYATMITTSLTLIKGLYIQKFFGDIKYFLEFNDLDLTSIFGISLFFLYYSIMKVIDTGKETHKTQRTKKVLNDKKEIVSNNDK